MINGFKKIAFLFILLFFLFFRAEAQVPGYMGKRLVVGYGLYANPAFSNILLHDADNPINSLHEFFVEYTTGKKFVLGFSARLYRYTYNNIEDVDANGASNFSGFTQHETNPNGSYDIKGQSYQLYGKLYKAGYLAPWGKYFILGLTLNRYQTYYDPSQMYVTATQNTNSTTTQLTFSDFGLTTQSYSAVDLLFGNGNSRIFGNRIVLDYGYTINTIAMFRIFINALEDDGNSLYPEDYIQKTSTTRVAAINRFNFFIKIGYLF